MLNLVDEFKKITEKLNELGIEYAICGGMAMAIHGHLRSTIDIDILILSNSIEIVKTEMATFGYLLEASPMSFSDGKIQIERITKIEKDSGDFLSLDLMIVTDEIQSIWDTREEVQWDTGSIIVVSKEGLIRLKQFRNSKQDIVDIEFLEKENEQ